MARTFVNQIKTELESNELLPKLWPDVFYADPAKDAPVWSVDRGLVVKRTSNPKECTVEGHGLVDGQPISRHFGLIVYNDVVTDRAITPEMINKTTMAWELSRSLSSKPADGSPRRTWYEGTRYHYGDTYRTILDREIVTPRIYPATDTGTTDGKPVFFTDSDWGSKKKENSLFTLACQYLQNPVAGGLQEFKAEWIRRYEVRPSTLNVGILVDPADSKRPTACNTAMVVIGIDAGGNKYLLDGACHKMTLSERWVMLKNLHQKWVRQPGVQTVVVGYEKYGMQSDIQHFQHVMQHEKYSFSITEVSWTSDGTTAKDDRIRRLEPDHRNWRFFYPYEGQKTSAQREAEDKGKGFLVAKPIRRVNESQRVYNLLEYFVNNEYLLFPASPAKDMMDAMSRFYDLNLGPPRIYHEADLIPETAGMR